MKTIPQKAKPIPPEVIFRFRRYAPEQRATECWPWIGAYRADGYGVMKFKDKQYKAHRIAYQLANGTLSPRLTVDHMCRNKGCVNPAHLEAVTQSVNILRHYDHVGRKTHCPAGHEYTLGKHGQNRCVPCNRANVRRWAKKNVAQYLRNSRRSYYRTRYGEDHPRVLDP